MNPKWEFTMRPSLNRVLITNDMTSQGEVIHLRYRHGIWSSEHLSTERAMEGERERERPHECYGISLLHLFCWEIWNQFIFNVASVLFDFGVAKLLQQSQRTSKATHLLSSPRSWVKRLTLNFGTRSVGSSIIWNDFCGSSISITKISGTVICWPKFTNVHVIAFQDLQYHMPFRFRMIL